MKKRKIPTLFCFALLLVLFAGAMAGCGGKDSAKKINQEGLEAYQKKNYEEAVQKLEQAVEEKPENAEYHYNYAFALIAQQKTKEAVEELNQVIHLTDGEKEKDLERKKQAYRGIGIAYFEAENYQKAASNFSKALKIEEASSMNEDILSYRADSYIGMGNYKKAAADYGKVLEENKKAADIYAKRGELYEKIGDPEGALLEYDKAIQLDKKNPNYYVGKYHLLKQLNRTEEMERTLETAMENCDGGRSEDYNLGYLLFIKEDYVAAEVKLQNGVKDGYSEANYYLGQIAQQNGEMDQAISFYQQCIADENEKLANAYNQLAVISIKRGDYKEASGFIKQGLSYHNLTVRKELRLNEIIIYEQKGYWEKAKKKAEELQKLYPEEEEISRELDFLMTRAKK